MRGATQQQFAGVEPGQRGIAGQLRRRGVQRLGGCKREFPLCAASKRTCAAAAAPRVTDAPSVRAPRAPPALWPWFCSAPRPAGWSRAEAAGTKAGSAAMRSMAALCGRTALTTPTASGIVCMIRFRMGRGQAAANLKSTASHSPKQLRPSPMIAQIIADPDHSEDEDRFVLLGLSAHLNLLVVIRCYRHENDTIRIISARKATRTETRLY